MSHYNGAYPDNMSQMGGNPGISSAAIAQ